MYGEPFAGGAGVAMALLLTGRVETVFLNDIDPAVRAFWVSIVRDNREFVRMVSGIPLTADEWARQRAIYQRKDIKNSLALGFAMFYLNRTNRSGMMNGGMIGGTAQEGPWKLDARFNRSDLVRRIQHIGLYASRIIVSGDDALIFIKNVGSDLPRKSLVYLDPPYYDKGQHLYTNYYKHDDHEGIASALREYNRPWVVSYDDHPAIRKMYQPFTRRKYSLSYAANERREGAEVMFFSPGLRF
jgi:DNA adenine methylase